MEIQGGFGCFTTLEIRCTGNGTVGSNPTHSASKRAHPTGWALLLFFVVGGIRKAALSGMPMACRNRRGFSAEKESHPHYQITGFSRSSGRGISYYGWGSKFILRSSKSHPLRQRAPLCTHSSFPETFVTALTPRSGKNARTTKLQEASIRPADDFPIHTKSKNRGGWFSRLGFLRFF